MSRNRILDVYQVGDTISAPGDLSELKEYLKVSHNDDDILIGELLSGATELLEKFLNIAISKRVMEVCFTHDGCSPFFFPYGPVQEITSVKYRYSIHDGVQIDMNSSRYSINGGQFKSFIGPEGYYVIRYDAGYMVNDQPIYALLSGIYKQVAWMYENRGDASKTGTINPDVRYMLSGYSKNSWL